LPCDPEFAAKERIDGRRPERVRRSAEHLAGARLAAADHRFDVVANRVQQVVLLES
jgi:Holliday junction resolvase-like predicted endonuclease